MNIPTNPGRYQLKIVGGSRIQDFRATYLRIVTKGNFTLLGYKRNIAVKFGQYRSKCLDEVVLLIFH